MRPISKAWTSARAAGTGTVAGLAALILWPVYSAWAEVQPLFIIALAISAFCGLSLLAITIIDLATHRRRSARLIPIRAFDISLGLVLTIPTLIELRGLVSDILFVASPA